MRYKYKILFVGVALLSCLLIHAQETDFNYQLILESEVQYTNPDNKSLINPDNIMQIEELTSTTKLYPIVKFGHQMNELSTALQMEGNITNYNFSKDSIQFTFQELYVQFAYKEKHYFSVGKRRLGWGSGMVWNPINFYIQKDPFRTQNRLEGIFQGSYTFLLPNGTLQAYIFREKELENFSYAVKYDYYGPRIDASLSFLQYTRYQQFGFDVSYGGDTYTAYLEGVFRNYTKSYRVGEDGSLIIPSTKRDKWWVDMVAGASINLNAHISLRGEYRFRQDYLDRSEVNLFEAGLPNHSMIYDPISIGKHTLFGSMEWKDTFERYFIQMRSFYDPVSSQLIISPYFIWKINNFQVELSSMIYNNSLALFNYQGSILLSCHF